MTFRLRPEAEADIEAIALYIADDSPAAARRWFDEIYVRCKRLGEMPGMGVARPEVRPDLRTFAVGNYLILYREIENGAEIVRVVHGARQWQKLFD
jgi:toxin ParE1/3/4